MFLYLSNKLQFSNIILTSLQGGGKFTPSLPTLKKTPEEPSQINKPQKAREQSNILYKKISKTDWMPDNIRIEKISRLNSMGLILKFSTILCLKREAVGL